MSSLVLAACEARRASVREEPLRQCAILEGSPEGRAFVRCLVDRFHWDVDSAALAAALLAAEERAAMQRVEDSLARVGDSLAREMRAAESAARAMRDAAAREERARIRREAKRAGTTLFAGDSSRKVYFWNSSRCDDLRQAQASDALVHFWDREEAETAGYHSSRAAYCIVGSGFI